MISCNRMDIEHVSKVRPHLSCGLLALNPAVIEKLTIDRTNLLLKYFIIVCIQKRVEIHF